MLIMDMIDEEWFSSDERFNRLMERLKDMERRSDIDDFCSDVDCDECPFGNWCRLDSNLDDVGDVLCSSGVISNIDDAWSYILKALPEEYEEHKKFCGRVEEGTHGKR